MTLATVESWDPRVWAADWTPSPNSSRTALGFPSGSLSQFHFGLLAAAAILATGAVSAWMSRPEQAPDAARAPASSGSIYAESDTPAPDEIRRTLKLPSASDLVETLTRAGVAPEVAREVAAAAAPALHATGEIRADLILSRQGQTVALVRLEASNSDSSGVVISRDDNGALSVSRLAAHLDAKLLVKNGVMNGVDFYSSAVAVGVPNNLIPAFAKVLAFDFNFQTEVTAGDAFELVYEQPVNRAGEAVGPPQLLFASLTTSTKAAAVYRFMSPTGSEEWLDASGRSIIRALMRTPVDGARVSSKFGMRFHPIFKTAKKHGGIDFAAPIGTPVYASGSGVIETADLFRGGAGHFIAIRHANGWLTTYMHLNRFSPGIKAGVAVSQGQQIAEVGNTGNSTGPHLHYEVHIDGEKVDPLGVQSETQPGKVLEGDALLAFEKVRERINLARATSAS